MTNDFFDLPTEQDFIEVHRYFTLVDAAHLIDDIGIHAFLEGVVGIMYNPMEQHMTNQLHLIAQKFEPQLLSMSRADRTLCVKETSE